TDDTICRHDANKLTEIAVLILVNASPQLDRPEAIRVRSDARLANRKLALERDGLWVRGPFGAHFIEHALRILAPLECNYPATRRKIHLERTAWNGSGAAKCKKPAVDNLPPTPSDNLTDSD